MTVHEACNTVLINNTVAALTIVDLGFDIRKGQKLSSSRQYQYRRWDPHSPYLTGTEGCFPWRNVTGASVQTLKPFQFQG